MINIIFIGLLIFSFISLFLLTFIYSLDMEDKAMIELKKLEESNFWKPSPSKLDED